MQTDSPVLPVETRGRPEQSPPAEAEPIGRTTTMNIEVKKDGEFLVIRIPINAALPPSKSGKSREVASTHGNMTTSLVIEGKPVILGLNAYIKAN